MIYLFFVCVLRDININFSCYYKLVFPKIQSQENIFKKIRETETKTEMQGL